MLTSLLWALMMWQQGRVTPTSVTVVPCMTQAEKAACFDSEIADRERRENYHWLRLDGVKTWTPTHWPQAIKANTANVSGSCEKLHVNAAAELVPCDQATICEGSSTGGRCFIDGEWRDVGVPPFDVPPVETRTEKTVQDCSIYGWVVITTNPPSTECTDLPNKTHVETTIQRACADKSRFLLMSEDGKFHCLKLIP